MHLEHIHTQYMPAIFVIQITACIVVYLTLLTNNVKHGIILYVRFLCFAIDCCTALTVLSKRNNLLQIMEVDSHIGAAMSGLIADARTLVDHARVEAQNHRFTYDEPMRVEALTQAVCDLALSFGEVRFVVVRGGGGGVFVTCAYCLRIMLYARQAVVCLVACCLCIYSRRGCGATCAEKW